MFIALDFSRSLPLGIKKEKKSNKLTGQHAPELASRQLNIKYLPDSRQDFTEVGVVTHKP